jgi:hypothetical protein
MENEIEFNREFELSAVNNYAASLIASKSWWKLRMTAISCGDVIGSCDRVARMGRANATTPTSPGFMRLDLCDPDIVRASEF